MGVQDPLHGGRGALLPRRADPDGGDAAAVWLQGQHRGKRKECARCLTRLFFEQFPEIIAFLIFTIFFELPLTLGVAV